MRSSSTPLQVMASPWPLNGPHVDQPANSLTLTNSRHSCSWYVLPSASVAVRKRRGVRCLRVSIFMGSPLVVTLICVRTISVAKRVARHFRGASVYVAEALCPPCVCALGGLFLFCFGVGVHGTNGRFFWPFEPLNCSQQSCEVV